MRSHRSSTETPSSVESENPYWISFSDIMAGLLAVFILVLISFAIKLDRQRQDERNIREFVGKIRTAILQEVQNELALSGIKVEISENNTVLHIPNEQLHFESGKYELQERMASVVEKIGAVLENALNKSERTKYIDTIFVEGHTDSLHDPRGLGNWGLSTHRAITVWKYWIEFPGINKGLLHMKNIDEKPIFSVSGYAATRRLVVPDILEADRKKNRRIDLRFTMLTPLEKDFQNLLDQLNSGL